MNIPLSKKLDSSGRIICAAICLSLLAGCASDKPRHSKPKPVPQETFSTEITQDGTKLFSYSLKRPSREGMLKKPGKSRKERRFPDTQNGKTEDQNRKDRMLTKLEKELDTRLEQKIEETGFCREGYLILDRYVGKSSSSIRGECWEGANDDESQDDLANS